MDDKITVQTVINENDNVMIEIAKKENQDECDPWSESLFVGMLQDVPEHLRGLEVLSTGWQMEGQKYQINVILD